ncbi:unnamed protein product [Ilex paraguariensis]|uniref:Uncharacterized protein n=1 Tax=Ilex paraguariensis TaxID=185542 RepID=A0ABC8SIF2_9AQUA
MNQGHGDAECRKKKTTDLETASEGKDAGSLPSKIEIKNKERIDQRQGKIPQDLQETSKGQQTKTNQKVVQRNPDSSKQHIPVNQVNQVKSIWIQLNGGKRPINSGILEVDHMANSEVSFGKSTLSIIPNKESQPTILERGDFSGKENTAQQERLVDAAQHECLIDRAQHGYLVDNAQLNSLADGIQGM